MPKNNTQSSSGKEGSEEWFSSSSPMSQANHFLSSGQQNGCQIREILEIPATVLEVQTSHRSKLSVKILSPDTNKPQPDCNGCLLLH